MIVYVSIFLTSFLFFFSLFLCIKYIFSRASLFWLLPSFVGFILLSISFSNLIKALTIDLSSSSIFSDNIFLLLILAFSWYSLVIYLRNTRRKRLKYENYKIEVKKALTEAKYIKRGEIRAYNKKQKALAKQLKKKTYDKPLILRSED